MGNCLNRLDEPVFMLTEFGITDWRVVLYRAQTYYLPSRVWSVGPFLHMYCENNFSKVIIKLESEI